GSGRAKIATGNRCLRVVVLRAAKSWVSARSMFDGRPAVISAGDAPIDLLELSADIVDKHSAAGGPDSECERIAQPQGPNRLVLASRVANEWVVGWDGAVGIEAQDFPLKRIEALRRCFGRLLADTDVKFAVATEVERSPLMAGWNFAAQLALVVADQQHALATSDSNVAVGRESADAVMWVRLLGDVAHIDITRLRKIGIDGHANQAPLPVVIDRKLDEGRIEQLPLFDNAQAARLLTDEEASVRCGLQSRAAAEAGGNRPQFKT